MFLILAIHDVLQILSILVLLHDLIDFHQLILADPYRSDMRFLPGRQSYDADAARQSLRSWAVTAAVATAKPAARTVSNSRCSAFIRMRITSIS